MDTVLCLYFNSLIYYIYIIITFFSCKFKYIKFCNTDITCCSEDVPANDVRVTAIRCASRGSVRRSSLDSK